MGFLIHMRFKETLLGDTECPLGRLRPSVYGSGIKGVEEGRGEGIRLSDWFPMKRGGRILPQ